MPGRTSHGAFRSTSTSAPHVVLGALLKGWHCCGDLHRRDQPARDLLLPDYVYARSVTITFDFELRCIPDGAGVLQGHINKDHPVKVPTGLCLTLNAECLSFPAMMFPGENRPPNLLRSQAHLRGTSANDEVQEFPLKY
jgi:hypothetical protein